MWIRGFSGLFSAWMLLMPPERKGALLDAAFVCDYVFGA